MTAIDFITAQLNGWPAPAGLPPDLRLEISIVPQGLPWIFALATTAPLGWLCIRLAARLVRALRRHVARMLAERAAAWSPGQPPLRGRP